MSMKSCVKAVISVAASLIISAASFASVSGYASDDENTGIKSGGGYAVTGQLSSAGHAARLYNATNGLPTSDANTILATSDGYIWIGGYSGLIRYDGSTFERQDSSGGLTNAKVLFEDSKKRLWVGTNDNGVVIVDKTSSTHFTYKDGLPSSTIRAFAESSGGTVFVGTTNGVSYVDTDMKLHDLNDSRLSNEYIIQMVSDASGTIYGNTRNGDIFCIESGRVSAFYDSEHLGIGKVTALYAGLSTDNKLYIGTDSDKIYIGSPGSNFSDMRGISVAPSGNVCCISKASGRIWVVSNNMIGWLDENEQFRLLENIPLNSSIETMTEDYQGNVWFSSSRQGVMKIVMSNFRDLTEEADLKEEVVNSTHLYNGLLYIGTDKGLQIIDGNCVQTENELTEYIGDARIRCIESDKNGDLWISTYTNGLGLVRYTKDGRIISYNEENGFVNNGTRCTVIAADGSVLECTNGGLVIIKDGEIKRTVGAASGISNTVFLTAAEDTDGKIYIGTDGDGIYIIDGSKVSKLGRDDGLTSDVILRIKRDDKRGVFWIVTSNSIEYMKDGVITHVRNFPYTNNYDIYSDNNDNIWILSSYGIYCVTAQEMIDNGNIDYRLYNTVDGLPSVPTGNATSFEDVNGDLYIAGRAGVSKVNINNFFDHSCDIKLDVRSIYCNDEEIKPDADGKFVIPAEKGRIQIRISVLNYNLSDPTLRIYLDGANDAGITMTQSELSALEYTDLPYGDYTLHVQLVDNSNHSVYQEETFLLKKLPKFFELIGVRIMLIVLGMALVGLIVWRIMKGTIIRRQYEQIRVAKEEAERANTAKSRFLANMSHEIRTPINTIMGMDEMILREDPTGVPKPYFMSVANYAMDIKNASESLLSLVNDVLDLSKIESGKMNLVEQEYDTESLLRAVITMIRVRSEQKGLSFDVDIDKDLPKRMYGDMGKIKQIVLNLLTNAVKYTEKGGFTLKAALISRNGEDCDLRISVKDTGIGVKPEDMDKLFSAFERLEEERNSAIQGTGLGLDISRQFAELMRGTLKCESVYGEGSEFILTVPQRIVDETAIGEFTEHEEPVSNGPYVPQFCAPDAKILVVDDNPMNLSVIKGLLKATKMKITTADSGEECLEKLREQSFHIVLLDHMMPGMDGLETVAHIRETMPDLPVFALTANAAAGGEAFYISKGFDGYLEKPINSVVLEKTIMKYLPEELVRKATADDAQEGAAELPEDMLWLYETDGISVPDGIKNSGGVDAFIFSLDLFRDTIDDNSAVIKNAYDEGDIRLYTVKVHALKTSARIIGAEELSKLALSLEDAGKAENRDFIDAHTDELLTLYASYKERLSKLGKDEPDDSGKEPVSEEELSETYEALNELIPQMDYDSVEMVIEQLDGYKLPEKDAELFAELKKSFRKVDWDAMEELMKKLSAERS